jgi:hypothetical protein
LKVPPLNSIRFFFCLAVAVFLYGCGSSDGVSSFGKRKYTKGYFADVPADKPGVMSRIANNKVEVKTQVENNAVLPVENKAELEKLSAKSSVPLQKVVLTNNLNKYSINELNPFKNETAQGNNNSSDDKKEDNRKERYLGLGFVLVGIGLLLLSIYGGSIAFLAGAPFILLGIAGALLFLFGLIAFINSFHKPGSTNNNQPVTVAPPLSKSEPITDKPKGILLARGLLILGVLLVLSLFLFPSAALLFWIGVLLILYGFITIVAAHKQNQFLLSTGLIFGTIAMILFDILLIKSGAPYTGEDALSTMAGVFGIGGCLLLLLGLLFGPA